MGESVPDRPFAEFASPPTCAVDDHRARLDQERRDRRGRWLFLAWVAAGAAVGAGTGLGVGVGADVVPAAVGTGVLGAGVGALVGWVVGVVAWAGQVFAGRAPGPFKPVGWGLVRGSSWDRLSAWVTVWGLIGILTGAAVGSMSGAALVREGLSEAAMLPWSSPGATAGTAAAVGGWVIVRRRGGRAAGTSEKRPRG